jgi:hypothetical protein
MSKNISKRVLIGMGLMLPVVLGPAALAQEKAKPEVKWSQATPIIQGYVDKLSAASKQTTGVEFSAEEKAQLVEHIKSTMQAQHIYSFVDP